MNYMDMLRVLKMGACVGRRNILRSCATSVGVIPDSDGCGDKKTNGNDCAFPPLASFPCVGTEGVFRHPPRALGPKCSTLYADCKSPYASSRMYIRVLHLLRMYKDEMSRLV